MTTPHTILLQLFADAQELKAIKTASAHTYTPQALKAWDRRLEVAQATIDLVADERDYVGCRDEMDEQDAITSLDDAQSNRLLTLFEATMKQWATYAQPSDTEFHLLRGFLDTYGPIWQHTAAIVELLCSARMDLREIDPDGDLPTAHAIDTFLVQSGLIRHIHLEKLRKRIAKAAKKAHMLAIFHEDVAASYRLVQDILKSFESAGTLEPAMKERLKNVLLDATFYDL